MQPRPRPLAIARRVADVTGCARATSRAHAANPWRCQRPNPRPARPVPPRQQMPGPGHFAVRRGVPMIPAQLERLAVHCPQLVAAHPNIVRATRVLPVPEPRRSRSCTAAARTRRIGSSGRRSSSTARGGIRREHHANVYPERHPALGPVKPRPRNGIRQCGIINSCQRRAGAVRTGGQTGSACSWWASWIWSRA